MFAYKGVLHAGKYVSNKHILSQNIKNTKIKISQLKSIQRKTNHKINRLELRLKDMIDKRNNPFFI